MMMMATTTAGHRSIRFCCSMLLNHRTPLFSSFSSVLHSSSQRTPSSFEFSTLRSSSASRSPRFERNHHRLIAVASSSTDASPAVGDGEDVAVGEKNLDDRLHSDEEREEDFSTPEPSSSSTRPSLSEILKRRGRPMQTKEEEGNDANHHDANDEEHHQSSTSSSSRDDRRCWVRLMGAPRHSNLEDVLLCVHTALSDMMREHGAIDDNNDVPVFHTHNSHDSRVVLEARPTYDAQSKKHNGGWYLRLPNASVARDLLRRRGVDSKRRRGQSQDGGDGGALRCAGRRVSLRAVNAREKIDRAERSGLDDAALRVEVWPPGTATPDDVAASFAAASGGESTMLDLARGTTRPAVERLYWGRFANRSVEARPDVFAIRLVDADAARAAAREWARRNRSRVAAAASAAVPRGKGPPTITSVTRWPSQKIA